MKMISACMALFLLSACTDSTMSQAKLEQIVKAAAAESSGEKGVVEFIFNGTAMMLVSDSRHDRMRIISAVANYSELSQQQVDAMMNSNFHSALDARYAVSHGQLYSAYIHPLSTLTTQQVKSALMQVHNLATTFGSSYSSGMLNFKGAEQDKQTDLDEQAI